MLCNRLGRPGKLIFDRLRSFLGNLDFRSSTTLRLAVCLVYSFVVIAVSWCCCSRIRCVALFRFLVCSFCSRFRNVVFLFFAPFLEKKNCQGDIPGGRQKKRRKVKEEKLPRGSSQAQCRWISDEGVVFVVAVSRRGFERFAKCRHSSPGCFRSVQIPESRISGISALVIYWESMTYEKFRLFL